MILECRDLVRSFDGVRVVQGVSMAFQRGRVTGIIGPNGAGKSTVLAMLAGTLAPTAGQIFFRGQDISDLAAYRRARLGVVRTFQLASEFKRLTVLENLLAAIPDQRGESFRGAVLGRRYWGAEERESIDRAQAMLERFGLLGLADRYAGDLSGGQRRLVEIMRALMAEPDVLLLDEPMAGVHPRLAHDRGCGSSRSVRRARRSSWSSTSCRSWTSSAIRYTCSRTGRSWPRARWRRCAPAKKSSRPTLSAEPLNDGAAAGRCVTGVALRTVELTAGYGGSPVIHGVSLSVAPGEVVSIVGPNGSGKSTLLKSIVGVVETLSGQRVHRRDRCHRLAVGGHRADRRRLRASGRRRVRPAHRA